MIESEFFEHSYMGYNYSVKDFTSLPRFIIYFFELCTLLAVNFLLFFLVHKSTGRGQALPIPMLIKASHQHYYSKATHHLLMRSPRIQTNVIIINKISTD